MTVHEKLDYLIENKSSQKIYYLGTGTSFDVRALCPEVDYTKVVAEDFIVNVKKISISGNGSSSWEDVSGSASKSLDITVSYNITNGIATINNSTINTSYKLSNQSGSGGTCYLNGSVTVGLYLVVD